MKFFFLLFIIGCAHQIPQSNSWSSLWSAVHFSGAGKTRLEVPPQSWMASFESFYEDKNWTMSLRIPTQGEVLFAFPGLDQERMGSIGPNDFRAQVLQALREASQQRKLNYPTLGRDFLQIVHHVIRWSYDQELGLNAFCAETSPLVFECERDRVKSFWRWDTFKEELVGTFALRGEFRIKIYLRNLRDKMFRRVTFEVSKADSLIQDIELRQDIIFR